MEQNNMVVMSAEQLNELINSAVMRATSQMIKPNTNDSDLINEKEVRNLLRIAHSTVWDWQRKGILSPVKIGAKKLYKRSDVLSLIA